MSQYIPARFVAREARQQLKRREYGLKSGFYLKYPNDEAVDYYVVKASQLYDKAGQLHDNGLVLKERMDKQLAIIGMMRAEEEAKSVAPEDKKEETPKLEQP